MSLLAARSVILGKTEVTYGTDPTPTTTDALVVQNLQPGRAGEIIDRNLLQASLSVNNPILGRKMGQISFDVELKGSGAAGTAADWGPFITACRFEETVVASTSVTYAPESGAAESITIYAYRDGLLHQYTGCRGDVEFKFSAGQIALMSFVFTGHIEILSDAAVPSVTVDSTDPVPVTGSSFTMNSYASVIANLNLAMANNVVMTDDLNAASGYGEAKIVGRQPLGSFDPEQILVATHDFYTEWANSTEMALTIAVGSTAGNIATFTAPKCVARELNDADRNGIMIHEIPFTAAQNTGDDEVSLAMT